MKLTTLLLFFIPCLLTAMLPQRAHAAGQGNTDRSVLLLSGDYPDPTVLKDGDDYYMTHSAFSYDRGFLIWHSRDLLHWKPLCRADVKFTGSVWAPDLAKVDGKYYIYFPANGTNYVAWADDIRGPWHGPVDLKVGGIDPGHVLDVATGKRYLLLSGGAIVPLSDDGLRVVGKSKTVYRSWPIPHDWQVECDCLEGPKALWHDGYYHIIAAQGGTAGPATSHMATDQRSQHLYGPWELSPVNPVVHTHSAQEPWWSKGHGTVVEGPDHQWWIIYHGYRAHMHSLGRHTLAQPVKWVDGWVVADSAAALPKKLDNNKNLPLSDDFKSHELGLQWALWQEWVGDNCTVGDHRLTLEGKGNGPADGRKLLCNAYDEKYEISVELLLPQAAGGKAEGGLLLFYDEHGFAGITADGESIKIWNGAKVVTTLPNTCGSKLKLRLVNDSNRVDVMVGNQPVARYLDVSRLHHNVLGGFMSLRPALLAAGTGLVAYKKFRYKTLH